MEPIDKASILQRLLARNRSVEGQRPAGSKSAPAAGTAKAAGSADVRRQIAKQLRAIDPSWPDAESRVLEVHVRALLAEEFGAGAATDPAFGGLVADVAAALRQHPQYEKLAAYLRQQLQQSHKQA
ncbi:MULTISPECIES: hypothetical protein [Chromobacterium]|uniref:Uncharacterized protein n=1 Tax=Chromobacterium fluminis TaxID=3044269 RepID=A0ABX0L5L0_9NEIS|nr:MULTISPECIES: hypothetical protein [Chromobacterium]MCP1290377.1 hypothetical protein [Chromobacterium sp. S0633]NHR04866.1 hypothetical protein [Chromobacterium haemolyticum]UJB31851.1 hypothetical protein HQN78_12730 [Chromobacterium sp. Beijing]